MAKKGASEFVCQSCGAVYPKWQGKCDACGEWNTIVEEKSGGEGFSNIAPKRKGRLLEFVPLSGSQEALTRLVTDIKELDRVCGGGLVPGSAILVAATPASANRLCCFRLVPALPICRPIPNATIFREKKRLIRCVSAPNACSWNSLRSN